MEEHEYRAAYNEINERRCVFEKAINLRGCACRQSHRFNLADREGVACQSVQGLANCSDILKCLRSNARFALQLTRISGPLPHNAEIKVQSGGLLGLQRLIDSAPLDSAFVADVISLVDEAITTFGGLENIPYDKIMPSIVGFEVRRKRRRS